MRIELKQRPNVLAWLAGETELDAIKDRLLDEPADGIAAWARTTSGIVAVLFFLQLTTGLLMALHYVPSTESAYATVRFLELEVRDGAWIRSLHYHSSFLLPLALIAHLLQMLLRGAYRLNKPAWILGTVLLASAMAAGATGYALSWDARAVNGVNIAASLTGNAPLVGPMLRSWLIDGETISTLTLSRFYGLHVLIIPLLMIAAVGARLFVFKGVRHNADAAAMGRWAQEQFARNTVSAGIVFVALSIYSRMSAAPFGPQPPVAATYLPRPGPQFLWLFEMQKYTDGTLAAILAMALPGLVIGGLIILPLILHRRPAMLKTAIAAIFLAGFGAVGLLTAAAAYQDRSDTRVAAQLAKQDAEEAKLRTAKTVSIENASAPGTDTTESAATEIGFAKEITQEISVPAAYTANCAKCHGASGEGTKKFPEIAGVTTREEDQLTPEEVLEIIDDPASMGRSSKMPSYKHKLKEPEKQEIVAWIRSLPPVNEGGEEPLVQTASIEKDNKQP
jgi:ubiquinol-cytochrome c reductase cytochrome b subunit